MKRMIRNGDDLNVITNHNKMLSSELTKVDKIGVVELNLLFVA
jgi:hypothetical protein